MWEVARNSASKTGGSKEVEPMVAISGTIVRTVKFNLKFSEPERKIMSALQ